MWNECSCTVICTLFGIGMKTDLFQSCGHCWVFRICWHIECTSLTASSFRTWNSSTGIPSPPLTLFVVMLPKAHLISHFRMSVSRWVTTPLWLSGSVRPFCTVLLWFLPPFLNNQKVVINIFDRFCIFSTKW